MARCQKQYYGFCLPKLQSTIDRLLIKIGIENSVLADKKGNVWFGGEEKLSKVENKRGIWCYKGRHLKISVVKTA